jgi:hypothetical protein
MTDYNRSSTSSSSSSSAATRGASAGTRRFEDYRDTYRSDWESRYGQNKPWQEHERGYRYGWESAQDDRFRNRQFNDAESDLQSGWSDYSNRYDQDFGDKMTGRTGKDYPGKHQTHSADAHDTLGGKVNHTWEKFKDSVREGFDRARLDR